MLGSGIFLLWKVLWMLFLEGKKQPLTAWPCGHLEAELLTLGKQTFTAFRSCCLEWALIPLRASSVELLTCSPITPERVHRGSEGALDERPWLISDLRLSWLIWRRDGKDRRGKNALHKCETYDKVSKSNMTSSNAILASSLTSSALKYLTGDVTVWCLWHWAKKALKTFSC